jgi:hypothetical protein
MCSRLPGPTLKDFAERDFTPFIESRFHNRPKTLEYYKNGLKNLYAHAPLTNCPLDVVTVDRIAGFVQSRRDAGLAISSINRQLEVLRRLLRLAVEWGKVEKALPKVQMPQERIAENGCSATTKRASTWRRQQPSGKVFRMPIGALSRASVRR